MSEKKRWTLVVVYAIAMAWVESAAVLYLRVINGRIQPYQVNPMPMVSTSLPLGPVEMVREAATLVMLITIGWLAGRTSRARLGYFVIAFGIWDIFYYVFLRVMTGWPASLMDWDVLFLLPLPWWGPVLAPVLISLLLVLGGSLLVYFNQSGMRLVPNRLATLICACGVLLSLYVFMADTLGAVTKGRQAVVDTLPVTFPWVLFLPALVLMAAPILDLIRQWRSNRAKISN